MKILIKSNILLFNVKFVRTCFCIEENSLKLTNNASCVLSYILKVIS